MYQFQATQAHQGVYWEKIGWLRILVAQCDTLSLHVVADTPLSQAALVK